MPPIPQFCELQLICSLHTPYVPLQVKHVCMRMCVYLNLFLPNDSYYLS